MQSLLDYINKYESVREIMWLVINATLIFVIVQVILWVEQKLYRKILVKRNNINLRYVEGVVRFAIIFTGFQSLIMGSDITRPLGRTLFQGTTVIAAIAGFAAQPVISDMICGLIISATRPFNIGDRIELDNGDAGIVRDITMRHVVIRGLDTIDIIIPNSKLNGMVITNMSNDPLKRSIRCKFHIAYTADVDRAMKVIAKAIQESPHTVPGHPSKDGEERYSPIYFLEYADSSLVMHTTVYYPPTVPTEVVRSDVNTRVKRALDQNGIEIPYSYVNVVMSRKEEE